MKIISHRGNIDGPIPNKENLPSYIDSAIDMGYDVEIDVRSINGELWLGHDEPQYQVTHRWLRDRRKYLWVHCKDIEVAKVCWVYQAFCHSEDPFVYTSVGKIWLHGNVSFFHKSCKNIILPLIDEKSCRSFSLIEGVPYGICTDYPILLRRL